VTVGPGGLTVRGGPSGLSSCGGGGGLHGVVGVAQVAPHTEVEGIGAAAAPATARLKVSSHPFTRRNSSRKGVKHGMGEGFDKLHENSKPMNNHDKLVVGIYNSFRNCAGFQKTAKK